MGVYWISERDIKRVRNTDAYSGPPCLCFSVCHCILHTQYDVVQTYGLLAYSHATHFYRHTIGDWLAVLVRGVPLVLDELVQGVRILFA
jgi:hypothetical protein